MEPSQKRDLQLLALLVQHERLSVTHAASLLQLSPGYTSQIARRLADRGYVTRMHNEDNWRIVYLSLTDTGRAVAATGSSQTG